MKKGQSKLSRRQLLRGVGAAIVLPRLECFVGEKLFAADAEKPFLMSAFMPNGGYHRKEQWFPSARGSDFSLPQILSGLKGYEKQMLIISGLSTDAGRAKGRSGQNDGPGDHARSSGSYFTATRIGKNSVKNGISYDQMVARSLGGGDQFPALNLGVERAGGGDSGYSEIYKNLSWVSPTTPEPYRYEPARVFEAMFGSGDDGEDEKERFNRQKHNKSILDFVMAQSKDVKSRVGAEDRIKIDEYLDSIRAVEKRLTSDAVKKQQCPKPELDLSPSLYRDKVHLMMDLAVLAMQCGMTRMVTLSLGNETSWTRFNQEGIPGLNTGEGWHSVSHNDMANYVRICQYVTTQMRHLFEKLNSTQTPQGVRLADQILLTFGAGFASGPAHNDDDLPFLIFGKGAGSVATGRHIHIGNDGRVANVWLAMMRVAGMNVASIGDSNADYRDQLVGKV